MLGFADEVLVREFAREAKVFDFASLKGESRVRAVSVELPGLGKKSIYIRHFFYPLIRDVLKATQNSTSGRNALIGGTPGIGKSTFGIILLMAAISAGKPCAYWNEQWRKGFVISGTSTLVFSGHNEFLRAVASFDRTAGALYISDTEAPQRLAQAQTVVITSPRYDVWKNFVKNDREGVYPVRLTLPTFDLEELEQMVQLKCVLPHSNWKDLHALYGGVPRHVFDATNTEQVWSASVNKAATLALAVYRDLNSGPQAELAGAEGEKVPDKCLHFHIRGQTAAELRRAAAEEVKEAAEMPAEEGTETTSAAAGVEEASDGESELADDAVETAALLSLQSDSPEYYSFDGLVYSSERTEEALAAALLQKRADDMLGLMGELDGLHRLAPVLGPIFERHVLQKLALGAASGWSCKKLTASKFVAVEGFSFLPAADEMRVFHTLSELKSKYKEEASREGLVLKPHNKNFAAIDAVLGNEGLAQVTLASKHGINANGLLKTVGALGMLRKKLKLYFFVPEEVYTDAYRKKEPLHVGGKAVTTPAALKGVEQYAVCVPLTVEGPSSKKRRLTSTEDEDAASSGAAGAEKK